MVFLVGQLQGLAGRNYVTPEERTRQAVTSLDGMTVIAERPEYYGFYEPATQQVAVERALANPQLADRAARVLGLLATPSAQRRLVTLASQSEWVLSDRQAAAAAFNAAVRRKGLLLTRQEILTQYDLYNASVKSDPGALAVLGAILDTIESPRGESNRPGAASPAPSRVK
jgi:hypothetical protein